MAFLPNRIDVVAEVRDRQVVYEDTAMLFGAIHTDTRTIPFDVELTIDEQRALEALIDRIVARVKATYF